MLASVAGTRASTPARLVQVRMHPKWSQCANSGAQIGGNMSTNFQGNGCVRSSRVLHGTSSRPFPVLARVYSIAWYIQPTCLRAKHVNRTCLLLCFFAMVWWHGLLRCRASLPCVVAVFLCCGFTQCAKHTWERCRSLAHPDFQYCFARPMFGLMPPQPAPTLAPPSASTQSATSAGGKDDQGGHGGSGSAGGGGGGLGGGGGAGGEKSLDALQVRSLLTGVCYTVALC